MQAAKGFVMATKYAIETVYKLIDNITMPLDKIGIKGKTVGRTLKNEFTKTEQQLANVGMKLKNFAKGAALAGIALVGVGIGVATKQFIDYDAAVTGATAKFKDLDVTSADYKDNLKAVGKVARDVAAVTEFNAVDTAGALDKMAMAGLTSKQSMALLAGTTNLATAAGADLTTAVDIATDALGAFGLVTEDEKALEGNLNRLSDVMAKTTNMFNTDISGFFESAKMGAATFTATGQSLEDFSAMVGVMASSGIKGSESGTQLRNMMLSLASPSSSAQKALDKLGVKTTDAQGNFLNIIDILGQFENGMKGMGDAEKTAALTDIFGKRTVTGVTLLLKEGTEGLKKYSGELQNAGGTAANVAAAMRGSLANRIEVLKSALTELGFKFVDAFADKGGKAIENLTTAITNFDPTPIINFLTTAFSVIFKVVGVLWKMRIVIISLVIAWGLYKAAMIAAVVVSGIMGMVRAVQTLTSVQQGMNAVQAIFNVLLIANPLGVIIVAIAALVAIIIVCVKHWDDITAAMARGWDWIKKNQEAVLGIIGVFSGPFAVVISVVREFWNEWDKITQAFKNGGIVAGLKQIGATILSALLVPLQGVFELLGKVPGVGKLFKNFAGNIDIFRNQIKGIEEPAVSMPMGKTDGSVSGRIEPSIAPVSGAQQAAYYSRKDNYEHAEISVRAEQGTQARVSKAPKSPAFNLAVSGSY
ncbi:phage tail tape measure protein [Treponema socranskii]|uniref:phage tail tape measure protein n=1 Tax=Treponema socranskii TaxID=53419 RepID=UPI0028E54089|nr:phage tail tape measure protein [Treponema socranskii]